MYFSLQQWLSCELRAMIYGYLLKDSRVYVHREDLESGRYPDKACFAPQTFLGYHRIDASSFKGFFDYRRSDRKMQHELTKAWYKCMRFIFDGNDLIPKFFASERWHHTTQPYNLVSMVVSSWSFKFWYYYRVDDMFKFRLGTEIILLDTIWRAPKIKPPDNDGCKTVITEAYYCSIGLKAYLEKLPDPGFELVHCQQSKEIDNMTRLSTEQ